MWALDNSRMCLPNANFLAFIVPAKAFIRTDRLADIASLTRLVILTKNVYILEGRKRNFLPDTYFLTNENF